MIMSAEIEKRRTSFSYAGCGFMGIYHIGVNMCLQEHAYDYCSTMENWYGASAGSIACVLQVCGIRSMEGYLFIQQLHDEVYEHKLLGVWHWECEVAERIRQFFERVLPKDAHRLCRNKVGLSLTVFPSMENWIVSDFNTRAELIQAVVCSSFIPLFSGIQLPKFRGKTCFDGGFSNNLPFSSDANVVTVSPYSGECDICPNGETETHFLAYVANQTMHCSWSNVQRGFQCLKCPEWKKMDEICAQGFHDAYIFIKKEGILAQEPSWPIMSETEIVDDDATSDYFSRTQSCQSMSANRLDELFEGLEERRDSSTLFVEEEPSEMGDDDSGIFIKTTQKFELKWKLKPKSNCNKSSVISTVSKKLHSLLETVLEYQNDDDDENWKLFDQCETVYQ